MVRDCKQAPLSPPTGPSNVDHCMAVDQFLPYLSQWGSFFLLMRPESRTCNLPVGKQGPPQGIR